MDNMNITTAITDGMKPHEKEAYLKHMEMRHKEEAIKIADEKAARKSYKQMMIEDIQKFAPGRFDIGYLNGCSVRTLERIYDNC